MAATSQITLNPGFALSNPFAALGALKTRFVQYRLYRRTLVELQTLGARELDDLGLNRSMLQRVAYQAVYENT